MNKKEVAMAKKTEREPMGAYIALSAAQLESAGVPEDMTSDELAECIDKALLEDDTALRWEIEQWIEDREREDDEARDQTVNFGPIPEQTLEGINS